jgi:hypothetical protein
LKNPIYSAIGALSAALATAHAAPVTWTTGPTETIGESSIALNGTLFHAGTWGTGAGAGPLTVPVAGGSITFENMTNGPAIGQLSAIATGGEYYDGGVWLPAGTADANFEGVMDGMATDGANPKSVIVNGLVPGVSYQIQLFVSDDRACCAGRTMEWSDSATDGAGAETATFAMGSSSHVIATFTADGPTQTFYGRGVNQTQNGVSAYVLRDLSPDTDGDGIPDHIEDTYAFLDKAVPGDALLDEDNDGLSNLAEYQKRLKLDGDTDDDGLGDGGELTAGTNPRLADSDGDTLTDGAEVNLYNSNPLSLDSDGDLFPDRYEAQAGSELDSAGSTPNGTNISRGTALLGGDLTDPENDGSDALAEGTGFNWVSATASSKPDFRAAEGALNIFDNKIGGGEAKWCCDGPPQTVTVQFANYTSLTHFTITSGNDAREREPRVWEIQGSNDGISFAPITRFDYTPASMWTAVNQVLRVDLQKNSFPYKYLRYAVFATAGATHQLGEIEFFGQQSNADVDEDDLPKLYEDFYSDFLSDSNPADAAEDEDEDGLSNLEEFEAGTDPTLKDTDGDGLWDEAELALGSDPFKKDSDLDGLEDGAEVNVHGSSPVLADTDGDYFRDKYEIDNGSLPGNAGSTPGGVIVEVLGTGTAALLGGDFTDRDNDGSDATAAGSGFDWVSATATNKADFQATEGALNVFDNKVGGGEAKWCCDGITALVPAQSVTVEMPYGVSMTHFTVTSSNDSPDRDPRVWKIQGSNDGVTFSDIFTHGDTTATFWGVNRDRVMKFTLPAPAPMYRWFRYSVTATQTNAMHALGELEFFGVEQDTDGDGMPDYYEARYAFLDLNDNSDAAEDLEDSDGLTNLEEFQNRTNPVDADSDDDGLSDGVEVKTHTTNPLLADTDGDQIPDKFEIDKGSDPKDGLVLPNFTPVDWGSPANITGNLGDFNTGGLLVHAWTGGASPVPIPALGITFEPGPSLGARFTGFDPFNRGNNADYENLLNAGSYAGAARFVEIPGLTVGESYRIQVWVADTRNGTGGRVWTYGTYDLTDERVDLNSGTFGDEANFPGQFVTGTFTATETRHYIYIESGATGAQYNAIMVHQTSGIPADLRVLSSGFNGTAFEMTVQGFNTSKQYRLRVSTTLNDDWADVGLPFTPAAQTAVVSDPLPPGPRAFYIVEELPPP